MSFPDSHNGELQGKSFNLVFINYPQWVEFSRSWYKCTGVYKDFKKYCDHRLEDILELSEHESRCYEYVKSRDQKEVLPDYLNKYR